MSVEQAGPSSRRESSDSATSGDDDVGRLMGNFLKKMDFSGQGLRTHTSSPSSSNPSSHPTSPTPKSSSLDSWVPIPDASKTISEANEAEDRLLARLEALDRMVLDERFTTILLNCGVIEYLAWKADDMCKRTELGLVLDSPAIDSKGPNDTPEKCFARMKMQAEKARKIASDLNTNIHIARAAYWSGRAAGGIREYKAAVEHFEQAARLKDSLRDNERENVDALLESIRGRYKEWRERLEVTGAIQRAEVEAGLTGKSMEECLEYTPSSPLWTLPRNGDGFPGSTDCRPGTNYDSPKNQGKGKGKQDKGKGKQESRQSTPQRANKVDLYASPSPDTKTYRAKRRQRIECEGTPQRVFSGDLYPSSTPKKFKRSPSSSRQASSHVKSGATTISVASSLLPQLPSSPSPSASSLESPTSRSRLRHSSSLRALQDALAAATIVDTDTKYTDTNADMDTDVHADDSCSESITQTESVVGSPGRNLEDELAGIGGSADEYEDSVDWSDEEKRL